MDSTRDRPRRDLAAIGGTYIATTAAADQSHDRFIAEQRQAIYSEYLSEVESVARRSASFELAPSDEAVEGLMHGIDEIEIAYSRIRVNGGQGIIDEARALADHLEDGVMSQLARHCGSADGAPPTACRAVPEGAPPGGSGSEVLEQYRIDMDALVVSMRGELDVPA